MYKPGDIVYFVDERKRWDDSLKFNTPYTVELVVGLCLLLEEHSGVLFTEYFISDKEYQISKRLEKLNKIKECLK